MTSLLTLSGDIRQNLTFKENSDIFVRIFTKQWINIIFFSQQDADHVAGDRVRTFMSSMETRVSSLINHFIFVDCHQQRIIFIRRHKRALLTKTKVWLAMFSID